MKKRPLQIAIVRQGPQSPSGWCKRLVEQICADPQLELSALLTPPDNRRAPSGNSLIRAWISIERRLIAKSEQAGSGNWFGDTEPPAVLRVDDEAAIERLNLDVILDLSGDFGRCCNPGLARQGVWFPDFIPPEPGLAGLASIISDAPVTTIALFRRTAGTDGCIRISDAALNTKPVATANELFMYEKVGPLILRELRRTNRFGSPEKSKGPELSELRALGTSDLVTYLGRLCRNSTRRMCNILRGRLGMRPGMFFLKSDMCNWSDFDPAKASSHISGTNSYFADPFLWEKDGALYCFFEEYDYRTARGHISVGKFKDGDLTEIEVALRTDYHLSFPFLFEQDGELYMMPETSEVKRVEIWKCQDFPNHWVRSATALEGVSASDSTLNLIDGAWWLFTNTSNDPFLDMNTELHIFKVDGPALNRIEPHLLNPVVLNSRQARNAGRMLEIEGKLYRLSQDNSHGFYGHGLNLMEVQHLSLDAYEETTAKVIGPDFEPGIIGCHHLDIRAGRVIMDVRKKTGGFSRARH